MLELEVLHAVIEYEGVPPQLFDGEYAGFHTVFIYQNSYAIKIAGQHERFVTGIEGAQVTRYAIAGNFG